MRVLRAAAVPLLVLLFGCQAARPPSRRSSLLTLHDAHGSAFPADREGQRSGGAAVEVHWSFSTSAGECVATTSAASRSPALTVRVDRIVRLAVVPGGDAARLAFSGPGGFWALRTAGHGRSATATQPLSEEAVSRLLALLQGGRLRLEGGTRPTVLLLPNAGVSGRDWIGCVNVKAREAGSTAGR